MVKVIPKGTESGGSMMLDIRQREGKYEFILHDPSLHTITLEGDTEIEPSDRAELFKKLRAVLPEAGLARGPQTLQREGGNIAEITRELGSYILNEIIPQQIGEALKGKEHPYLILSTNELDIPWELAYDGENFLCLKYSVGRKVKTSRPYKTFETPESTATGKLKMLIIANPTGDRPGTEKEADTIAKGISKDLVEIDRISGQEATAANIRGKLRSEAYDILHYAGHAEFNPTYPSKSGLILNNNEKLTANYISKRLNTPLKLVFVNACSSARACGAEDLEQAEYLEQADKLTNMAKAFLSRGIDAYIGTLWPVDDEAAPQLAIDFYKSILSGESIGLALRNAKRKNFENYSNFANTWASFVLYGSPEVRLIEPGGVTSHKPKRPAEELSPEDILKVMIRWARADGPITPQEYHSIMTEAMKLGLSQKKAQDIFNSDTTEGTEGLSPEDIFKATIRLRRTDGSITPQEHHSLMTTAMKLGLSQKKAEDIYKGTA